MRERWMYHVKHLEWPIGLWGGELNALVEAGWEIVTTNILPDGLYVILRRKVMMGEMPEIDLCERLITIRQEAWVTIANNAWGNSQALALAHTIYDLATEVVGPAPRDKHFNKSQTNQ